MASQQELPAAEDRPKLDEIQFAELPLTAPDLNELAEKSETISPSLDSEIVAFDRGSQHRKQLTLDEMFNPNAISIPELFWGWRSAIANGSTRETGETKDIYMVRPGDDVQITLPTAGPNPSPISENCTVVDFYSSNMHEYDSSFAFMPLKELQKLRGMIDPGTGNSTISAIQIKLKPDADPNSIKEKLAARFPPEQYPYVIQTWQDTQRPLLSAVNLELTILNILLFLIIAVAGLASLQRSS